MTQFALTLALAVVPFFPLLGLAIHYWAGEDGESDFYRFPAMVAVVVVATLVWQYMWDTAGRIIR
ncbi:MAG TPA: hypothetical protein VFH56_00290 [Acidimicrobiales bacterium]|nr:hypothetical protein [Acidimicrobiales bacterium]